MSNKNICNTVELFLYENYENFELLGPFKNFNFGGLLNQPNLDTKFENFFLVSDKNIFAEFRTSENSLRFEKNFFLSLINFFNITPDVCEECIINWWEKKFSEFNVNRFFILTNQDWAYMKNLI
jgi:hypothetical protein